jgi:hypothetical protein
MAYPQFAVVGTVSYILKCPKAPGEQCDPSDCSGHTYQALVSLYVEAPDAVRAEHVALGKVKSAYPFPLFDVGDLSVMPVRVERQRRAGEQTGDPLPGFEGLVTRIK